MNRLSFLITRIKEYRLRYETETYHPELNNLLGETLIYLEFVGGQLKEIKDLLKKGE